MQWDRQKHEYKHTHKQKKKKKKRTMGSSNEKLASLVKKEKRASEI